MLPCTARASRVISLSVMAFLGLAPLAAFQGEATAKGDVLPAGVTVVASGLVNPRGFTWGPDGALYVALAGNGGVTTNLTLEPSAGVAPAPDATPDLVADSADVLAADASGAVVRIVDGCPHTVVGGLPSYNFLPLNWADGVIDVTYQPGSMYDGGAMFALVDGGGEAGLHPDQPNGLYRLRADGTAELVADLSAWLRANPVAEPTHDISPDGQPYAVIFDDGGFWISESNHEQLLSVTPDGAVTRVVDLSPHAVLDVGVPTGVVAAPDDGLYVSLLSEMPLPDGGAKVIQISKDGSIQDVWTGLTAVTDLAIGPDGALYASQLATGNEADEPFYHPFTGSIVRQTGPASSEPIVTGLNYPVHLGFGPDGALYVSGPALGANGGEGVILRIDPAIAPIVVNTVPPGSGCSRLE